MPLLTSYTCQKWVKYKEWNYKSEGEEEREKQVDPMNLAGQKAAGRENTSHRARIERARD